MVLLEPIGLSNMEHALSPTNDSERLLFRNLFHNVIHLDCQGATRPGLAQSWSADSGGRGWTFTLREAPGLPGVSPETATQVARAIGGPQGKVLGIDSVTVLDQRRLRVSLRPGDSTPDVLADPALAVTTGWAPTGAGAGGNLPIPARRGMPVVNFRFEPKTDARDALDRGADLVVTRDAALVDYVSGLTEFAAFPLPWSRTYVLLQPAGAEALSSARTGSGWPSLAEDAVHAEARVAEAPFWWSNLEACPAPVPPISPPRSSRVVYARGDEVARGLAERVVALEGAGLNLRTEALEPAEFAALLRNGSERVYVVALPRQTLAPCREAASLPGGARIQPLIDTRAYAVVRRGAPPLTAEWDGTVRVVEP